MENSWKIIKECKPNRPLNPSIRFDPLIINKKHKDIKIRAKTSICKRRFKKAIPVNSIYNPFDVTKIIKNPPIISNLNFGSKFILKSSINPNKKNNEQKEIYSG